MGPCRVPQKKVVVCLAVVAVAYVAYVDSVDVAAVDIT